MERVHKRVMVEDRLEGLCEGGLLLMLQLLGGLVGWLLLRLLEGCLALLLLRLLLGGGMLIRMVVLVDLVLVLVG